MVSNEVVQKHETADVIATAFTDARKYVCALTSTPEFDEACRLSIPIVNPYDDMDKPLYWEILSAHVDKVMTNAADGQALSLEQEASRLLAETPRFLFTNMVLESRGTVNRDEKNYAREVASYYNQLIRSFAYAHPKTRVSDMKQGLLAMANMSIEDEVIKQIAVREVYSRLHGAQHEIAFGQILGHTGYEFNPATTEQDLDGVDYLVKTDLGNYIGLDVKASDRLIARDSQKNQYLYSAVPGNPYHLIVHSLTGDSELGDSFFTPESTALQKSGYLRNLITSAERKAVA